MTHDLIRRSTATASYARQRLGHPRLRRFSRASHPRGGLTHPEIGTVSGVFSAPDLLLRPCLNYAHTVARTRFTCNVHLRRQFKAGPTTRDLGRLLAPSNQRYAAWSPSPSPGPRGHVGFNRVVEHGTQTYGVQMLGTITTLLLLQAAFHRQVLVRRATTSQ